MPADLIQRIHQAVFGTAMSPDMHRFMRNLSWSTMGGVAGAGLMFAANILAGRLLGPETYGLGTFVVVIATTIAAYGPFGFDVASVRTLPRVDEDRPRRGVVSTGSIVVLVLLAAVAAGVALAAPTLARAFEVPRLAIALSALYGFVLGLRTMADRQLSGLEEFRYQGLVRPVEGALVLGSLLALVFAGNDRYTAMVGSLVIGGAVVTILYVVRVARWFSLRAVSRTSLATLWSYARIALVHAITPLGFLYADKFIVKADLGAAGLGVYNAYYSASYLSVMQIGQIITNVLFPAASSQADQRPMVTKLNRLRLLMVLPLAAVIAVVVLVVLLLFGDEFPIAWETIALCSLWSSLLLFNGLLTVLAVTHSERSYLWTAGFQGVRSVIFVGLLMVVRETVGLSVDWVFALLLFIELVDAVNIHMVLRRFVVAPRTT